MIYGHKNTDFGKGVGTGVASCHWHGKIGKICSKSCGSQSASIYGCLWMLMDALQNICQILDEASRQLLRFMIKGLSD